MCSTANRQQHPCELNYFISELINPSSVFGNDIWIRFEPTIDLECCRVQIIILISEAETVYMQENKHGCIDGKI